VKSVFLVDGKQQIYLVFHLSIFSKRIIIVLIIIFDVVEILSLEPIQQI
jgi:hypothetical protein